jgi:L-fuculose-phosphate aldolase
MAAEDVRKEIIRTGRRMQTDGMTIGAWGNISARDADGNICITPSGMDYQLLVPEDIIRMDADGNVLEGMRKPSVETPLHLAVYKARPDCRAIVHTHPIYSTAFSVMGENIPLVLDEAAQQLGDTVRTAEYALPGTKELAENCVRALGEKSMACLLKAHGAVCLGGDLRQAYLVSGVLESAARILSLVRSMGGQAEPISAEDIAAMQEFMRTRYGQNR